MKKMIKSDPTGNWQLDGVSWEDLRVGGIINKEMFDKLYSALWKLKDYEASGLTPDEVIDSMWA